MEKVKKFVSIIEKDLPSLHTLYLVGDIFNVWIEYREVIPKRYHYLISFLGEVARNNVIVKYITGNHDLWHLNFFECELGIKVFQLYVIEKINGRIFYISHGDNIIYRTISSRIVNYVFRNRFAQFLYRLIHPDIGLKIASAWAKLSREYNRDIPFVGESEPHIIFARKFLLHNNIDFFVMGHRHTPIIYKLTENKYYINIGDWRKNFTYLRICGNSIMLNSFDGTIQKVEF